MAHDNDWCEDSIITGTVEPEAAVPALRGSAPPAVRGLSDGQFELARRTVAPGLSPDEFEVFKHACVHTGLDPLMKQIYGIKRGGKMTLQIGIDGARLIADRTGKYAGSDDPIFSGQPKTDDFAATVTVYKIVGGVRCPFTATARWSEYCPPKGQDSMWQRMPHTMLGKCAEMLALRKAFPADLSGLYTHEEMEQADRTPIPVEAISVPDPEPAQKRQPVSRNSAPSPAPAQPRPPASRTPAPTARENEKPVPATAKMGRVIRVFPPASGEGPKGPWTRFDMAVEVEGEGETKVSTFSESFGAIAEDAAANNLAVWLDVKPNANPKFKGDLLYIGYAEDGEGEAMDASDAKDMPF